MKHNPRYQNRLQARDRRHGLAPDDEHEERPERSEESSAEPPQPRSRSSSAQESEVPRAEEEEEEEEDRGQQEDQEPNTPNVRRRVEEWRGVTRDRDDGRDLDGEDGSSRNSKRRLEVMEKAIADVVDVGASFAAKNGLWHDDRCTREIARRMLEDLDAKHPRKLKTYEDVQRHTRPLA